MNWGESSCLGVEPLAKIFLVKSRSLPVKIPPYPYVLLHDLDLNNIPYVVLKDLLMLECHTDPFI